jgi:hypothetical protein
MYMPLMLLFAGIPRWEVLHLATISPKADSNLNLGLFHGFVGFVELESKYLLIATLGP